MAFNVYTIIWAASANHAATPPVGAPEPPPIVLFSEGRKIITGLEAIYQVGGNIFATIFGGSMTLAGSGGAPNCEGLAKEAFPL